MRIFLTGATGFVGSVVLKRLIQQHRPVIAVRPGSLSRPEVDSVVVKSIDSETDWGKSLLGCDAVIHLAARVHVMTESVADPLSEFQAVNTDGTLNLAEQAAKAGVKRFIFISSIKVNGERTIIGAPFKPNDEYVPDDPYGLSKYEAEKGLLDLSQKTGMEVVIIRPPLVYGSGVKANFASLLNLVSKGIPLPFGCIKQNKRSLVSLGNLVDLIITCIDHPKAANQVFLVSDDHDLSTAELIQQMSKSLGVTAKMLPVPLWCYSLAGKLLGKQDVVDRLTGSLQADITHTKETLGWVPPQTIEEAFNITAQSFLQNKQERNNT